MLFLISELLVLFFLSVRVQRALGFFLYKVTRSKKVSIYILSLLFMPGTLVHELSHLLTALFLFVPAGGFEVIPEIEKDHIKLGSIKIGKTDPARRFLISTAPFFVGTILVLILVRFISMNRFIDSKLLSVGLGYLLFTVSNTMFISNKDFEGVWGFLVLTAISVFLIWFLGININLGFLNFEGYMTLIKDTVQFLLIPILFDIIALGLLK